MKRFIRFSAFGLAAGMVLLSAACGGGEDSVILKPGGGIANPWWETTGEMTYEGEEPVYDDIDIELVTVVTGDDMRPFADVINQFNREYDGQIHVNVENISQETFEQTVGQRISTGANAPDLIMSHNKSHKSFAESRLIQPFDEAYEAARIEFNREDYVDGLIELSDLGYENTQFSIPIDGQSLVIYYNKGLLSSIGKEVPTTHAEFLDVCAAFAARFDTSDDFYAVSCGVSDNVYFQRYLFMTMYIQNGGELYNTETLRAEWTNETNLQAFKDTDTAIKDLTNNGYFKYGENLMTAETRFFQNKSLFLIDRPWAAETLFDGYMTYNPGTADINSVIGGASSAGLFAIDPEKPTANYIFGDSHAFAMSKTVKDIELKAAIAEFTNWFTHNAEAGATWGEGGHMSASKVILASDDYNENAFVNTFLNGFYSSPDEFVTIGNTVHYSELIDRLYDVATQCLMSPDAIEIIVATKEQSFNDYVDLMG